MPGSNSPNANPNPALQSSPTTDTSSPGSDSTLNVSVDFQAMIRNQRERERAQMREGSPRSGLAPGTATGGRPTRVWTGGQASSSHHLPSTSRNPRTARDTTTTRDNDMVPNNRRQRRANARLMDAAAGADRRGQSLAGDAALWEERKRLLEEYHTRARQMINYPLRLLHAPVPSDDPAFQPLCFCRLFFPCMYNKFQESHFETSPSAYMQNAESQGLPFPMSPRGHLRMDQEVEEQAGAQTDRYSVTGAPSSFCHNLSRLFFRFFCLQCSVAQQTSAVYTEREQQRLVQPSFLCSCFYAHPRNYSGSLWAMICCDIFSLGIPCCLCCGYRGLGTAFYAWRLRYWIRCRYGLKGTAIRDLCSVVYCPLLAVDQQATELEMRGIHEFWTPCPKLDYYTLQ